MSCAIENRAWNRDGESPSLKGSRQRAVGSGQRADHVVRHRNCESCSDAARSAPGSQPREGMSSCPSYGTKNGLCSSTQCREKPEPGGGGDRILKVAQRRTGNNGNVKGSLEAFPHLPSSRPLTRISPIPRIPLSYPPLCPVSSPQIFFNLVFFS